MIMRTENLSETFGIRLKSARKMAGFSMDGLSEKLGGLITKQAISKYENGLMKPASGILIRLADALGVKPDYFFRKIEHELSDLHFRKKSRLPRKKEEALKHKVIDFVERYTELESLLGQKQRFYNPLKTNTVRSQKDVERVCREVREQWELGLAPIGNMLNLLEDKGIKVFSLDHDEAFDGLTAPINDSYVIVINKSFPLDRMRFTAAHELSHILCDFSGAKAQDKERLCHSFAGAFLLPQEVLEREFIHKRSKLTLWELGEIKEQYGISMQAIMKRAVLLGFVTDHQYRHFQKMFNQKHWRKKEPFEYRGKEEAVRFKQLLSYAVAENIISFSKAVQLAAVTRSDLERQIQALI
jgi:Zn-dependent peptidase ImmA (M78 family)/DNA-binding XRE family transcriptional regulator